MFNAILKTQWNATRVMVLLTAILAFAVPLASLQDALGALSPQAFVETMQKWGGAYAVLAALTGLFVGMAAWRPDQTGRHVYALSLPISRARYVMFRFAAGGVFIAPSVVALLVGALLVTWSGAVPESLRGYPFALALRFAFAAAVAYSMFFAIAASTSRTAGLILAAMAGVVFGQYLVNVIGSTEYDILGPITNFIFLKPGILSVFSGRWMLVDV